MKVFLGGTCNDSNWREGIISQLSIDFYNPLKEEWSEKAYEEEIQAKLDCNYFLYCLTPKYTGYFSFAEVINESYHFSNQTIFCFLEEDGADKFSLEEIDSLKELGSKVIENGGLWLENLEEVSTFLNSTQTDIVQLKKYDFFISYGRKHSSALASKLNHSFIKEGRTVWMDKFCIPAGVDFQMSINDGIMRSDNFIYIISPHSVQSEYCTKELEVALKLGKRIIPILHVMEPGLDVLMHPEVQKLNWYYFDSERKFQHGFSELLKTTSVDPGYLEANTKWLQKAVEWDSNERDKEFLLGETETILAEAWYLEAIEKEKSPPPSELNGEFINESIKGAALSKRRKKRNGFLIRVLSVVMSIAFVVAIVFFMQSRKAERLAHSEKEKAVAAEKIAQSEKEKAVAAEKIAQSEKEKAIAAKKLALSEKEKAVAAEKLARSEKEKAVTAEKLAESEKEKAVKSEGIATLAKAAEEDAKKIAEENEKKANLLLLQSIAKSLFKQANELKTDEPELSKNVAVLAYQLNQSYSKNARNQDAYEFSYGVDKYKGPKHATTQAIKRIIRCNDKVFVFDLSGNIFVLKSDVYKPLEINAGNKISDIDVSPESNKMLVRTVNNDVISYNVSGDIPVLLSKFSFPNEQVYDVHMGNKGVGYVITDLGIYSLAIAEKTSSLILKRKNTSNAQIESKEGVVVAILEDVVYNVSTGSQHKMESKLSALYFLNSGSVIVGDVTGKLYQLNLAKIASPERIGQEQHKFEISAIRYSSINKMLYTCSIDQTVKMWSLNENGFSPFGEVLSYDKYNSWVRDIEFLDASEKYLMLGGDSKVIHYIPANYDFIFKSLKVADGSISDTQLKTLIELDNKELAELRENAK